MSRSHRIILLCALGLLLSSWIYPPFLDYRARMEYSDDGGGGLITGQSVTRLTPAGHSFVFTSKTTRIDWQRLLLTDLLVTGVAAGVWVLLQPTRT